MHSQEGGSAMLELGRCICPVVRLSYDGLHRVYIHDGLANAYHIGTNHATENLVGSRC